MAAAEAAAEVVDILIAEPTEDENCESFPPSSSSSASARGATHLLRSPRGARRASARGEDDAPGGSGARRRARVGDASDSRGTLVPDRLGEVQRTPTRVSGGGGGDARRRAGVRGRSWWRSWWRRARARPTAPTPTSPATSCATWPGGIPTENSRFDAPWRTPRSRAPSPRRARDSPSIPRPSSRRRFVSSPPPSPPGFRCARVRRRRPVAPLGGFSLRCARVFAFALDDARGVHAAVAAADACSTLATRYAEAGTRGGALSAAAARRGCASPSPSRAWCPPVAAVRRRGRAPRRRRGTHLVHQAQDGRRAGHRRRAQRVQGRRARRRRRRDFLQNSFFFKAPGLDGPSRGRRRSRPGAKQTRRPQTHRPLLPSHSRSSHDSHDDRFGARRSGRGVRRALGASRRRDGGSLDELAILACALRAWPSTTSPPDAAATRDGVAFIRGLGFEWPSNRVAARFASRGWRDRQHARGYGRHGGGDGGGGVGGRARVVIGERARVVVGEKIRRRDA